MTDAWMDDDDELLAEIGSVLHDADSVPPEVLEAAKSAYTWRTVDMELAALVYEAAVQPDELVTVRSTNSAEQTLMFRVDDRSLELESTPDSLMGQIDPPSEGELIVEWADGKTANAPIDELGWFTIRPKPPGTLRLRCLPTDGRAFVTEWMRLR